MQTNFRKLSVDTIFYLRSYRKTHSRSETAKFFGVSVQWVSQCMSLSDAEILSSISPDKSPLQVATILETYGLEPICGQDNKLSFRYTKGKFKGLITEVSAYYLLEAEFQTSFQTLTNESKEAYIERVLKKNGAKEVTVARVGNEAGIKNTYNATVDGKKLYWKELAQLVFN